MRGAGVRLAGGGGWGRGVAGEEAVEATRGGLGGGGGGWGRGGAGEEAVEEEVEGAAGVAAA